MGGSRQAVLLSFISDKPAVCKVFCEPETIRYKKLKKFVLDTITFYLEDDSHEEVDFNGETINFALQMMRI